MQGIYVLFHICIFLVAHIHKHPVNICCISKYKCLPLCDTQQTQCIPQIYFYIKGNHILFRIIFNFSIYNYSSSFKNFKSSFEKHCSDPNFPRTLDVFLWEHLNAIETNWCLWALVSKLQSLNVFRCDQYFLKVSKFNL